MGVCRHEICRMSHPFWRRLWCQVRISATVIFDLVIRWLTNYSSELHHSTEEIVIECLHIHHVFVYQSKLLSDAC